MRILLISLFWAVVVTAIYALLMAFCKIAKRGDEQEEKLLVELTKQKEPPEHKVKLCGNEKTRGLQ